MFGGAMSMNFLGGGGGGGMPMMACAAPQMAPMGMMMKCAAAPMSMDMMNCAMAEDLDDLEEYEEKDDDDDDAMFAIE